MNSIEAKSDLIPDIRLVPFSAPGPDPWPEHDALFSLYELTLRPHIEAAFGWDEGFQRQRWAAYADQDRRQILIEGLAAGLLVLRQDPDALHVSLLLLDPAWQGRGLGRRVMERFQTEAETSGLPVTLSCFRGNTRALAFYQGLGYQISGEDEVFYDLIRPRAMEY